MSTDIDFEQRARDAAAALRHSVRHIEPAAAAPSPGPARRLVLAGAAVLVLVAVVVGAVVLLTGSGDDGDGGDVVASAPDPLPRLVPGAVPAGLELQAAVDLADPPADMAPPVGDVDVRVWYFGAGTDDDPFAAGDLLVMASGDDDGFSEDGDSVTVQGHPGTSFTDDEFGISGVQWSDGDRAVVLVSRAFDADRLLELAQTAVVATNADPVIGTDLTLLGSSDRVGPPNVLLGRSAVADEGYVVVYASEADTEVLLTSVTRAEAGDRAATLWWLGPDAVWEDVDGRRVIVGHAGAGALGAETITRLDGDVTVSVTGYGVSYEDVLAAYRSLGPVTDAEWADLVARGQAAELADRVPDGTIIATDDSTWWVYVAPEESLCIEVADAGGSSSSCTGQATSDDPVGGADPGPADELTGFTQRVAGGLAVAVTTPTGTATVLADGVELQVIDGYAGGFVPTTADAITAVALAPDGTELARIDLPADGGEMEPIPTDAAEATVPGVNATGDMDGVRVAVSWDGTELCLDAEIVAAGTGGGGCSMERRQRLDFAEATVVAVVVDGELGSATAGDVEAAISQSGDLPGVSVVWAVLPATDAPVEVVTFDGSGATIASVTVPAA